MRLSSSLSTGVGKAVAELVLSRIIIIAAAILSVSLIGIRSVSGWRVDVPVAGLFARWDSSYYLAIAETGYTDPKLFAFRPLFPMMLRGLGTMVGRLDWQTMTALGFVVNNILFLVAAFYLYKLTMILLD